MIFDNEVHTIMICVLAFWEKILWDLKYYIRGTWGVHVLVNRIKSRSVVYQYTVFLLAAMMFIAVSLTGVTVYFNASQLHSAKLERIEESAKLAVKDLDNQFEIFQSIATAIEISNYYRPLNLQSNAYNEIVMLEDFVSFYNWSPLCNRYFMFYHDSNKIYQYNGKINYWEYLVADMNIDEPGELYKSLNEAKESFCIPQGNMLWIVYPLRFRNSSTGLSRATIVFLVENARLQDRIDQVSGEFPEKYLISWNEKEIFSTMSGKQKDALSVYEPGKKRFLGEKMLLLSSKSGGLLLNALVSDSVLKDLKEILTSKIYISIAFCVLLIIGLAFALAQISALPVRRLVHKYGTNGYLKENEFELLDDILVSMNNDQKLTVRELRKQFIALALRGYYDSRQSARWDAYNLIFDKSHFCVCVIDTQEPSRENMEDIVDSAEECAFEDTRLYAAANYEDGTIEVIINYSEEEELKSTIDKLNHEMLKYKVDLFAGSGCDNQKSLPISYMQALTAMQKDRRISVQDGMDVKQFAARLVEAARTKNSSFLSDLAKLLWDIYPSEEIRESTRNDILSRTIVDYIEENVGDCDFGLEKLAIRFGFSADYISSVIKRSTGKPFKEYLTMRRLELAKELLKTRPEMTVNDISFAVGYRKSSNFIKKFKDVFGCTPVQYRG